MPDQVQSGWSSRRTPPPRAPPSETIALRTASGVSLTVEIREPLGRATGTAILLHSTMASRRIFGSSRPDGFAEALTSHGLRTLALDFRGHGDSGIPARRGGTWNSDDLVREDLPALCLAARERWPNDRLSLVGHSLGGQVALASTAARHADADAIVIIGTNLWLRREEPNPVLLAKKVAVVRLWQAFSAARGYFPARALGVGSDDEAGDFVRGWVVNWERDSWRSDDGNVDYFDALAHLDVPVLAIASIGDSYICTPQGAFRLFKHARSSKSAFHLVRRSDDGGGAPDHMGLVTRRLAPSIWHRAAKFCLR